jgi:hypothetical protein
MTPTDGTYRLKRSLATRGKRGLNLPRGPAAVKLGLARAVIERGGHQSVISSQTPSSTRRRCVQGSFTALSRT